MTSADNDEPCYDDYTVGERFVCGSVSVELADIIAFARQYDPQAKHIDPLAAAASSFGTIIASGWHTASLAMRLLIDRGILSGAQAIGIGIDELRWFAPVRGGDTLALSVEIVDMKLPQPDARRGVIRASMGLTNQTGKLVFSQIAILSLKRSNRSLPPVAM